MKKITRDDAFADHIGRYIMVIDNGVMKKYKVEALNKNNPASNFSILTPDTYTLSGGSSKQECDICDDPCIQNIPILQFSWFNIIDTEVPKFETSYYNEIHDMFLNENKLATISTSSLSAYLNRIWIIPNTHSAIEVPISQIFKHEEKNDLITNMIANDSIDRPITACSCIFVDPSFYLQNSWNVFHTVPVTANNVRIDYSGFDPSIANAFYIQWNAFSYSGLCDNGVYRQKIIENTNGTSALSCTNFSCNKFNTFLDIDFLGSHTLRYGEVAINDMSIGNSFYANNGLSEVTDTPYGGGYYRDARRFSSNEDTVHNHLSVYFPDLDPCILPENYSGFEYASERYYKYVSEAESSEFGFAYNDAYDSYNDIFTENPSFAGAPPCLRKFIGFIDENLTEKTSFFLGYNVNNIKPTPTTPTRPLKVIYDSLSPSLYTGKIYFKNVFDQKIVIDVTKGHVVSTSANQIP